MSSVDVNGITLSCERRGPGPSVLSVSGATGDAGHRTAVAKAVRGGPPATVELFLRSLLDTLTSPRNR